MALVEFEHVEKILRRLPLPATSISVLKRTSRCPPWTIWFWEIHSNPYHQWFGLLTREAF